MQPKSNNPLSRLPTWVAICIGVFIGLFFANVFTSDVSCVPSHSKTYIWLKLASRILYGEIVPLYHKVSTPVQNIL